MVIVDRARDGRTTADQDTPNRRVGSGENLRREPDVMTVIPVLNALIAHQGGWDEILLVAGPILVIVGLLALVKRRLDR